MEFGDKLRIMRSARKITQQELGERVGLSNLFISMLERNTVLPTPETEQRIMAALNWTPDTERAFETLGGNA